MLKPYNKLDIPINLFPDLVNNYDEFHKIYDEKDLINLPSWTDNSDYSHLPSIFDIIFENHIHKPILVRMPLNLIFSSEKSKGGYDRTLDIINSDNQCRTNLNQKDCNGNIKGYDQIDASALSCYIRWSSDGTPVCVKYIGNNRIQMKLLANRGEITEVAVMINVHPKDLPYEECLRIEAENHCTDAGNRQSQNENQKFFSEIVAQRKGAVECFNFLRDNKLDFSTKTGNKSIMEMMDISIDNRLTLSNLGGLQHGYNSAPFTKFGIDNLKYAVRIAYEIGFNVTDEKVMNITPIKILAMMYKVFTNYGVKFKDGPLFTVEQLDKFFIKHYEVLASPWEEKTKKLNNLTVTGSNKDIALICVNEFFPSIQQYYKFLGGKDNSFTANSCVGQELLKFCQDKHLRKDVKSKINNY